MIFYAFCKDTNARLKAQQYLKKPFADTIYQQPAHIIAKYLVLDEDTKTLNRDISYLFGSPVPLLESFGLLFDKYFPSEHNHESKNKSNVILLNDEKLLFSMHIKKPWEKALAELMLPFKHSSDEDLAKQQMPERIMYVAHSEGNNMTVVPQRHKWLKSQRWGAPMSLSWTSFVDQTYPYMEDVDRHIAEAVRGKNRYT